MVKKEEAVGLAFMALLFAPFILLATPLIVPARIERLVREGEGKLASVQISVGAGNVAVVENGSIRGWRLTARYSSDSKVANVKVSDGALRAKFESASVKVEVSSVELVKVEVKSGNVFVALMTINATLSVSVENGNVDGYLLGNEYSVAVSIVNGNLEVVSTASRLSGNFTVVNGDVSLTLITRSGGAIKYDVLNGGAEVFASGFRVSRTPSGNGESGVIECDGSGISISVRIANGNLKAVVQKR